jgi:hypothetical protein
MTRKLCSESFILADGTKVSCTRKAAPPREVCGHEHVCLNCFEAWGMENEHYDGGHDEGEGIDCPECGTYDPRGKQGHTNNTGTHRKHRSHALCDHPRTPAGRAACRKVRNAE